ncbi:2-amino-4-hydroxy-6-hydroxymethyldihydropteridine diphosphokinase [Marinagarivorans cellulosilyticus]|uniref:2-amino-4-hydroxy-6-hydroxymethyldihydropteridine diphosphokinase n=1 Tax=Marinagarivorans cellulosilyticus TaxID=2721545 RepID=A0AAN1WGW7_9GAMM|nr:2-amino-4-hydroxy-6-hydroxymethyldihydropteridine diphosphokinase [Marinagarivorans cellulosilyticus]BCD97390.1 2-amino-4-hydroxy-6-hydroxymethyldihydropteridine diphosphokinase [Marinagarivorans cellulosilyticus]
MAEVLLGLGSNQNAKVVFKSALNSLQGTFGALVLSPVYESESVGFDGDNFLNMVVQIQTHLPVGKLLETLRAIEDAHGRDRTQPKFGGRTLDIDILTYDDVVGCIDGVTLPRDEVLKNAFVLRPLADTWPSGLHPELKRSYRELWSEYDKSSQNLWLASLDD